MKIVRCHSGNIMMVLKEVEDVSDKEIRANSVDAAFEKHVPQYEKDGQNVRVFVNHVMEEDHFIEWLLIDYGTEQRIFSFHPGDKPEVVVKYQEGMRAYSYCNKHSLWAADIVE